MFAMLDIFGERVIFWILRTLGKTRLSRRESSHHQGISDYRKQEPCRWVEDSMNLVLEDQFAK